MTLFPLIGSPVDVQSERFTQIPSYVRFPVDQELIERQRAARTERDSRIDLSAVLAMFESQDTGGTT